MQFMYALVHQKADFLYNLLIIIYFRYRAFMNAEIRCKTKSKIMLGSF